MSTPSTSTWSAGEGAQYELVRTLAPAIGRCSLAALDLAADLGVTPRDEKKFLDAAQHLDLSVGVRSRGDRRPACVVRAGLCLLEPGRHASSSANFPDLLPAPGNFLRLHGPLLLAVSRGSRGKDPPLLLSGADAARTGGDRQVPGGRYRFHGPLRAR